MRFHLFRRFAVSGLITACLIFVSCGRESNLQGGIPPLALKTYDGELFQVTTGDGHVTLLVFWATWCRPCLMEIPGLVVLQEKYRGRGLQIVGINVDDATGAKALPIMRRLGVNYPMLVGDDETSRRFGGVNALPTSFLIGKDGKIKEKIQGLLPEYLLEEKITAQF